MRLNVWEIKEVRALKYSITDSVLSKDGSLEDELKDKVQQGRMVAGTLRAVI